MHDKTKRMTRATSRWQALPADRPMRLFELLGATRCAPMDSGMNLPTSSFRSHDDASRCMISTIFLRMARIWTDKQGT